MSNFKAGWYVIYTSSHHERKVSIRLDEMEIQSFFPTVKTLRTWRDRKKYIAAPLFPSYVFVYLNNIQNYYKGLEVEGVLHYVRFGKEIARVHDSIINNLKLLIDGQKKLEVTDVDFKPGQKLIIEHGPLTGLSCEVIKYNGEQKLLVRINLLRRSLLVELQSEYLMANHA